MSTSNNDVVATDAKPIIITRTFDAPVETVWRAFSPDGKDLYSTGVYREIVPMEKIVCTDAFSDAEGNVVSASEYGMADLPEVLLVTFTFEDVDGKTKMTLRHEGIPAGEMYDMCIAGWNQSFDKLAVSIAGNS